MSLHAELSQEARQGLARQKRNSTIASVVISTLVIMLIFLTLGIFLLPDIVVENPTIVTYSANSVEEKPEERKKVSTTIQRKPSAPSSSQAPVIASTSASPLSIPVVDMNIEPETLEFGDGEGFGGGWGESQGFSGGGEATFFNQSVKAARIAYVIDYSGSMSGEKDKLMRDELTKSVSSLKPGSKYQMVFFSGPAWVAGSEVKVTAGANIPGIGTIKGKGGKTYNWTGIGYGDWTPKGDRQPVEWLDVTSSQIEKSLKVIKEDRLSGGTDWENPLQMVFAMDPPPQIVFFMTDGAVDGRDMMKLARDLASEAKKKDIVVNTVAMMEPNAEEAMLDLAKRTDGVFTVVDKDGKAREVKRVNRNKK
ncbi:MAG: vWA domain-containing protein [Luteolibacter sp.]